MEEAAHDRIVQQVRCRGATTAHQALRRVGRDEHLRRRYRCWRPVTGLLALLHILWQPISTKNVSFMVNLITMLVCYMHC